MVSFPFSGGELGQGAHLVGDLRGFPGLAILVDDVNWLSAGDAQMLTSLNRREIASCESLVEPRSCLDIVYVVNELLTMATVVQSCRIEAGHATLLSRQAKRRHLEVSTLSSLYLKEKALEEEYPGVGFRDSVGGREAYILGHRIGVWEVVEVSREAKTVAKTARHFRWPPALVRCALAFAKAFPVDVEAQRRAEIGA